MKKDPLPGENGIRKTGSIPNGRDSTFPKTNTRLSVRVLLESQRSCLLLLHRSWPRHIHVMKKLPPHRSAALQESIPNTTRAKRKAPSSSLCAFVANKNKFTSLWFGGTQKQRDLATNNNTDEKQQKAEQTKEGECLREKLTSKNKH